MGVDPQSDAQLPTPSPIAIEASVRWWWLVDLLERLDHQPVLSHPNETKVIPFTTLKNDNKVGANAWRCFGTVFVSPRCGSSVRPAETHELVCHRLRHTDRLGRSD